MFLGHTISIKRAAKILVNASKLQTERDRVFAEQQEKMMSMMKEMQQIMQRVSSQFDMRKKVDINEFFPIKSLPHLDQFLNKLDGQFHQRREEFENLLYCNVTKTIKLKRPFEAALLSSLFTREFLSSHKWPRYLVLALSIFLSFSRSCSRALALSFALALSLALSIFQ